METNYIAKRLKLILPVFALLMLSSFLVNAQDKSSTAVLSNTIEVTPDPYLFCDVLDETVPVEGTVYDDLDFIFGGDATTATVTIGWQYSMVPSGGWSSTFFTGTAVLGGWLQPVNLQTGTETVNGVTVSYGANAYADLDVSGITDYLRIRRVVAFTTDDPTVNAEDSSDPVTFEMVESELDCEDNVISLEEGMFAPPVEYTSFCLDELPTEATIYGQEVYLGDELCGVATYTWYHDYVGSVGGPFVVGNDRDLVDFTVPAVVTTHTFWRQAVGGGVTDCPSNEVTVEVFDIIDLDIAGPTEVCIPQAADNMTAVYTAVFDLIDGTDYTDYQYIWSVEAAYGTFDGIGTLPNQAVVKWHTETPMGEPAFIELEVITPDGCTIEYGIYLVDVSRRPLANITTPDEQEFCMTYGQFDDEGDYFFVGAIELNAEFSVDEPTKHQGIWTKITGPDNVIFVEPADGFTVPDPFDTASWDLVDDPKDYNNIWAVAVWPEEELTEAEDCLELGYAFQWTEFGKHACSDSWDYIKALFYKPYLDFTADIASPYETPICGLEIGLTGTPLIDYCFVFDGFEHEIEGEWTVTGYPDGVDPDHVHFSNGTYHDTYASVPAYGTYEFTWTVENGACGPYSASVEATFDRAVCIELTTETEICNNFSLSENFAYGVLSAEIYYCEEEGEGVERGGHLADPDDYILEWKAVDKPEFANWPTIVDEHALETDVRVSSLGTYTFTLTATSKYGAESCSDEATVALHFHPGIKDANIATIPEEKTCSLYFDVEIDAIYDFGNLSGPNNLDYGLAGEITVKRHPIAGSPALFDNWTWWVNNVNEGTSGTTIINVEKDGAKLTFNSVLNEDILEVITFYVQGEAYGKYTVEYDVWVTNAAGDKIEYPDACELFDSSDIELYWDPIAEIEPNDLEAQICGVGELFAVRLDGRTPKYANIADWPVTITGTGTAANPWVWNQGNGPGHNGTWNQSVIDWYAKVWDADAEEWMPTDNIVFTRVTDTYGLGVYIYAEEQGEYRIFYEVENRRGPDCIDVDWQDIAFLVKPDAGDEFEFVYGEAYKYEFCGELIQPDDKESCLGQGWDGVVEFHGFLEATNDNVDQDIIEGFWQIDVSEGTDDILVGGNVATHPEVPAIGYVADFTMPGEWKPAKWDGVKFVRHDWIKFYSEDYPDGAYIFDVHQVTGNIIWTSAWDDLRWEKNPDIEVSRHGVYEFTWIAYNPLLDPDPFAEQPGVECGADHALHEVYFKNTPLARDLKPIRVVEEDGDLIYVSIEDWVDDYEWLNHPFDDCYACAGKTQFYMLERPIVEQKHGVAADAMHVLPNNVRSTVPATHSVLWYNAGGTGIIPGTSPFPQIIEGGTIDATYVLQDGKLVSDVTGTNWNKHFIIEVTWEGAPQLGEIRFEEENTITDCKNQYEFEITLIQPQEIVGPVSVPAYTHDDDTTIPDHAHEYYLDDEANPIPGAVYRWSIDADDLSYIIGGYVNGTWTLNTGADHVMEAEGLHQIRVYWGAGLPSTVTIPNPHGFVQAEIINSCHDPIEDLRVDIIENTLAGQLRYWNQEETFIPTPFKLHPNNIQDHFYVTMYEVYPADYHIVALRGEPVPGGFEETVVAEPDTDLDLSAYFAFGNIDLTKSYRLKVWDGGFSYLEEGTEDVQQNFLSFTYTWNGWSPLGISATDALAIIRMAGGITELNDLTSPNPYWWVGDLDDTPAYGFFSNALADVNSIDGLNIIDVRDLMRRVVGDINQFRNHTPNFMVAARFLDAEELPAKTFGTGDEVTGFSASNPEDVMFDFIREDNVPYEGTTHPDKLFYRSRIFTLNQSSNLINIYYAGVGDINSKNSTPMGSGITKATDATLAYTGEIEAQVGDVITVPVRVSESANIAATTIGLTYNTDLIEVLEVDYAIANIDNDMGRVRVASVSTQDEFFGAGDAILNVTVKVLSEMVGEKLFELESITEFANFDLEGIDVNLNSDAVSADIPTGVTDIGAEELSVKNYPNPFRTSTTIEYTLPESGKVNLVVYNRVGQVVAQLVDETQEAGRYTVELNSADLGGGDGLYIYRITVEGQTRTFVANGNLTLMK